MRSAWCSILLGLAAVATAQVPVDPYCSFPPDERIDLNGDSIPDLLIQGYRVGTDDEPSSSGFCTQVLRSLPGTSFFCMRDRLGEPYPLPFGERGSLEPTLWADMAMAVPRWIWTGSEVRLQHWPYGSAALARTPDRTEPAEEVFAVCVTIGDDTGRFFAIRMEEATAAHQVVVRILGTAESPEALAW